MGADSGLSGTFTCLENSNRKKDMSSKEQKQYWNVHKLLTVKPYPDMNLFEMQATFPYEIMQKGESYFTFETLTGLFNEKGKKIYPPYSGRSYISGDLNFFTFPKRKDGRVYTVYTYKYFFGSGEYFCYDLLCFKDGKEMKHFPIKKYWGGD